MTPAAFLPFYRALAEAKVAIAVDRRRAERALIAAADDLLADLPPPPALVPGVEIVHGRVFIDEMGDPQ